MAKLLIIIILFGLSCTNRKFFNDCYLKNTLNLNEIIGVWEYAYSCGNSKEIEVALNNRSHINKIEFLNLDWLNLKERYSELNDERKVNNSLSNIILRTYDHNDSLIDEYIPIAEKFKDGLTITIYGVKIKNEFLIFQIDKEKMVITDGRVYKIDNNDEHNVVHHYTKCFIQQ